MEIKIKKIGFAKGTVGWLAAGLQDKTLRIIESTLKANGHHGLWLKGSIEDADGKKHDGDPSQFLAAYNQYDLTLDVYAAANTYECADHENRNGLWTDAAWESLMRIARVWCAECNEAIQSESPVEINVVRVEVQK